MPLVLKNYQMTHSFILPLLLWHQVSEWNPKVIPRLLNLVSDEIDFQKESAYYNHKLKYFQLISLLKSSLVFPRIKKI